MYIKILCIPVLTFIIIKFSYKVYLFWHNFSLLIVIQKQKIFLIELLNFYFDFIKLTFHNEDYNKDIIIIFNLIKILFKKGK